MKLINISLKDEPLSIYIQADGHVLDLHNAFDFEGFRQNIGERSVSLFWRSNRYAILPLPVLAFEIVFADVDYFEVTPRDPEIPDFGEDLCLSGLSRVWTNDATQELISHGVPLRPEFTDGRFHLWFAFRSGQNIRVGAKTAEFRKKPA
jgi:hypothetical protein